MIPNHWYAILESSQLKPGKPIGVTRLGEKLVVWRDSQGKPAVAQDLCPHRGVALSIGKLKGDCVECSFHGFLFDPSGRCTLVPANGKAAPIPKAMRVRSYPVQEAHGFIFVWWGEPQPFYPPIPWFSDVPDDEFSYAGFRDHWPVHYTRAVENQLDVIHLPFVHANSIGRGGRTIVDGPRTEWTGGDRFSVYMCNRQEDGSAPRPAEDIPVDPHGFHIDFIFPNLWQNWLGEKSRIILAFVPIDEGNTLIYARFYQKFVRTPGLRSVVNWLSQPANLFVLRQDKRVVLTEWPIKTDLRMGEKLVPGDGPIIAYRRYRADCQAAASGEKVTA